MSHVTRTSLSWSKGQSHQAALLTAVLARQAPAAVGVRTCCPWETAATLPSARQRKALRHPRGEGEGRGHIVQGSCAGLEFKASLEKSLNIGKLKKALNCFGKRVEGLEKFGICLP